MRYPAVTAYIHHILVADPFWRGLGAQGINDGNCDSFAQALVDQFPTGDGLWGDAIPEMFDLDIYNPAYHCFFRYCGESGNDDPVYFDSECPEGVTSPCELPFYQRQKQMVPA